MRSETAWTFVAVLIVAAAFFVTVASLIAPWVARMEGLLP